RSDARRGGGARAPAVLRNGGLRQGVHAGAPSPGRAPAYRDRTAEEVVAYLSGEFAAKEVRTMATKTRSRIYPHLWYAKEAEEAAGFYASIFPDSRVERVTPLLSESPSGPPGS